MKRPESKGSTIFSIGMLVVAARRNLRQLAADTLKDLELTPHEYWLLMVVQQEGPLSLTSLAGRMWMDLPTVSRAVKALSERELLQVKNDPRHGRKLLISIHPQKGRSLMTELLKRTARTQARLDDGLGAEDIDTLQRGLARIIENVGTILKERADEAG